MAYFSIRNKFFTAFSLVTILALVGGFVYLHVSSRNSLQKTMRSELSNSTELISSLVETVARSSIENHLRSIAETQLTLVAGLADEVGQGRLNEAEAKAMAARFLLRQTIGETGYSYCLDSRGVFQVHPDEALVGSDISSYAFVKDQLQRKTGYLEYQWQNQNDERSREKALYMVYFPQWDWIISVSAYKSEFVSLIDIDNIANTLRNITFGESGYPFIVAGDGQVVFHPTLAGNIYDVGQEDELVAAVEGVIQKHQGEFFYHWEKTGESEPREMITLVTKIDEYDWFVATTAYLDELYLPLQKVSAQLLLIFVVCCLVNMLASYILSSLITRPLSSLILQLRQQEVGDLEPIVSSSSHDEIGDLAVFLNRFIAELNERHELLRAEIEERKQSERALLESEKTFHTLFDNSYQFSALLDSEGRVCKVNKTALCFAHLTMAEVEGVLFWETRWWCHSAEEVAQLRKAIDHALTGETSRFEVHSTHEGDVYFDISIKPVLDDCDRVIYLIAEGRDVTEVRRAEQELQQVQKMESIGILAGGIAHDFNNSLAVIFGALALLKLKLKKNKELPPEILQAHLERIFTAAQRAKDVVSQLLNLARKNDVDFVVLDLRQVFNEVCYIADTSFDKSIVIETDFDAQLPVYADANSLEQVFLNLCINAAHAMTLMRKSGTFWGGTLRLSSSMISIEENGERKAGDYWCLHVEDTGVGIDATSMERLFVPFFTTKDKGVGTGLGMSMVYNSVNQHRGFVEVESTVGQGTVVRVFLPVCHESQNGPQEETVKALAMGNETILVIDDEELVRCNLVDLLSDCGYHMLQAADGREGLELYRKHRQEIALVVLDLVMPVMSGREAFFALREIDPQVKVLVSSGFRQDERIEEMLSAGANAFVEKPCDVERLTQTLRALLD